MRVVSFGDVHMALSVIDRLAAELRDAEVTILSGDLTNYGGAQEAEQVLTATRKHARRVLAVPGNLDHADVLAFLCAEGVNLHGESRRLGPVGIFGCGGSNVTPFRTPTEFSEADLTAILETAYAGVADAPQRLMVCHTPPFGTLTDRIASGQHVGSAAVRAFIEQHQPDVCLTGHIHESAGVDQLGRTMVINAGRLQDGGYIVVRSAGDGVRIELKRLSP